MAGKTCLLGVEITNESEDKILEYLWSSLRKPQVKYYIVTPNPEILTYAQDHPHYKHILNKAKLALPDGIGVFLGCALMGHRLKERIPGVDFLEEVCRRSKTNPVSIGFLGAGPGVAKRTAECLMKRYPWIKVRFVGEEWDWNSLPVNVKPDRRQKMKSSHQITSGEGSDVPWVSPYISLDDPIDILFVAFGFPKQEEWIAEHLSHLPVKVAMGVGGAFDYISGDVLRAPFLIRAVGMEWLFRLIKQPWRWRRQVALIKFVGLVLRERIVRFAENNS
jgi:N-acetylglucosaminyldiphosphoundecaprenol N-acetyl-beta-D-mannosaminyltransferase